jgi:hypothetical protein
VTFLNLSALEDETIAFSKIVCKQLAINVASHFTTLKYYLRERATAFTCKVLRLG